MICLTLLSRYGVQSGQCRSSDGGVEGLSPPEGREEVSS